MRIKSTGIISAKKYLLAYFSFLFFVTTYLPYKQAMYVLFFSLFLLNHINLNKHLDRSYIAILVVYTLLISFQSLFLDRFSLENFLGVIILISFPFFTTRAIGVKYIEHSINIIYFFTVISFFFYIPTLLVPGFYESLSKFAYQLNISEPLGGQNFIIYTVKGVSAWTRNSGNFPEPGSFAAYLCFALVFNILLSNGKLFIKKNTVFVIGILTTQSTAGYLALGYLLIFYFLFLSTSKFKLIYLCLVVFATFFTYTRLDFLQEKMVSHYEQQQPDNITAGRFGSTHYNISEIRNNPYLLLHGRGILKASRFDKIVSWEGDEAPVQNLNSFTNLLVQLGAFGFIIVFYFWIISLQSFVNWRGFKSFVALLPAGVFFIVLSSQPAITNPLFWSLFYLGPLVKQQQRL